MRHVEFVVILDEGVRKRHVHTIEKGIVQSFAVQLELYYNENWLPVIRYDNAHGKAHIDKYFSDGKKEKTFLDLDYNTALTLADWDINTNWEKLIKDYWRDKIR